jgi:hypothetical protein
MKTLSSGSFLKMPLVSALIFGGAAYSADTFTESPHTFTEESKEYTTDLRIGDSGKTMYVTNNTTAITVGNSKNFAVGAEANGIGSYVQNGGSLDVSSGKIYVGRNSVGTGYFELNGGSVHSSGTAYFGSKGGVFTGKMTGGLLKVNELYLADKDSGSAGTKSTWTQDGGAIECASWFVVGRSDCSSHKAVFTLNSGAVTNKANHVVIGCYGQLGSEAKMIVNGGELYCNQDIYLGENASATLEINDGVVDAARGWVHCMKTSAADGEDCYLNLNGGALRTKKIVKDTGSATTTVTFNGGALVASETRDDLIAANDKLYVKVGAKGGTIDSYNFRTAIYENLDSGVEDDPETTETETDGGMTFTGKGIVELKGAANYQGLTYVESGVLALTNGYSFAGPVKIGRNGAIAVDITPARTAATDAGGELAVEGEIALFSTTELTFEEATDDITTSIFLTGPVVGYTLSQKTAEGVTTVYATVTNIDNITATRKVTTVTNASSTRIDEGGAYSNGAPADNPGFDVVIVCGDGTLNTYSYYHARNDQWFANRAMGHFVVRGGTATFGWTGDSRNGGSSVLLSKTIAGNGTLRLVQSGIDGTTTTISNHVSIELSGVGASAGRNATTWLASVSVDGDVYATNGFVRVDAGVTFNGTVYLGNATDQSYLNADGASFNGNIVISDGVTFNCNGKTATFGEDARLVLMGGTVINSNNIAAWPKTVIENGFYVYGTAPIVNADCTVKGGKLRVSVTKDGDNETLDLGQIKVPDGVSPADVLVVTDTQYNWSFTVDQTTRIVTATQGAAKTDADANVWYGGAEGDLSNGQNWTRGVPTDTQTVKFISDAVVKRSDKATTQYWKELVIENNARVEFKSNDGNWPNYIVPADGITGNGTLVLRRCGLMAVGNSTDFTIPATITLVTCNNGGSATANDSWLNDHNATATITVNGSVTNENYFITRGKVVFNDDVTVKNGAKFEVQGQTTFNKKLVFTNGGTLALNGANTSVVFGEVAAIEVLAGTVSVPRSSLADGGSVSLSSGAGMLINMNGEDEPLVDDVAICLGVAFSGDAAKVSFSDSRAWDWTASVGQDGKLYATPKSTYQNHWIGGESGLWNDDGNWEFGTPKMTECAVFTNNATATATDNGEHKMDKLVIESGKTVRFTAPTSSNWPQLNLTEFPEGGTLEIGFGGIESYDGKELALNGNITITNDGTRDAFIKAKNGRIVINGKLTITGENTKANILGQNNMLINGEIALDTSTENRNVRITRASVDGNITGSGYIQLDSDDGDKQCSLNGDNRGFSGRIDKINNNGCILGGPNAAGTNIEWHVTGDLHLVAENAQEWKFGALNFDWTGWNVCYITKDKSITLEVGSLGQDMTFKNAYKFWGEGANTDITVTIRKVGAGKLTTGAYNYKHLIVEAGEVALEKPTAFDNKNFKNINSVSVASGATISGYPGTQADGGMYIQALTLAPGAIVKQTLVATTENEVTTYSCPVLTVTGDVNVSGVKFVLDDPSGHLISAKYDESNIEKYTILQANTVTGRPAAYVFAKIANSNWGWRAFVEDGNKVVVKPARTRMVILIR